MRPLSILILLVPLVLGGVVGSCNPPEEQDTHITPVHEQNVAYFRNFDYENLEGINHLIGPDFVEMERGKRPPEGSEYYNIQYVKVLRNNEGRVLSVQSFKAGEPHGFWTYFNRYGKAYRLKYYFEGKLKQQINY
jgi:hypothetical protein